MNQSNIMYPPPPNYQFQNDVDGTVSCNSVNGVTGFCFYVKSSTHIIVKM